MDTHVSCNPAGTKVNDRGRFHVTTYSVSFNDVQRHKQPCFTVKCNSYITNLKPYIHYPTTSVENDSGCEVNQFLSVAHNDFNPFQFSRDSFNIPNVLADNKSSNKISTFREENIERSDFAERKNSWFCDKKFQYINESGKKLCAHNDNVDIITNLYKNQAVPLTNLSITYDDFTHQFFPKPANSLPNIEEKSSRVTGNTREIPLSGENWFPFDRKSEPNLGNFYKNVQPLAKRLIRKLKRDPSKIINTTFPRLVSMHQASYLWPSLDSHKIGKDVVTHCKNCVQSAYSITLSDNIFDNEKNVNYCTETANEFTNRFPTHVASGGYVGNILRIGTNYSRMN